MSNNTRDVGAMSDSALKAFLDSFDHVVCDCDGVLYRWVRPK